MKKSWVSTNTDPIPKKKRHQVSIRVVKKSQPETDRSGKNHILRHFKAVFYSCNFRSKKWQNKRSNQKIRSQVFFGIFDILPLNFQQKKLFCTFFQKNRSLLL